MWACFCWLQKSSVCCLTLKTRPSCPGITLMLHFTTGLITGSLWSTLFISGRLPCWASPFEGKDFLQVCKSFYNNNYMWCFFLIWWHLTILRWTGATLCTLTTGTMRLLTLLIVLFLLFAPCICKCVAGFVSSHIKDFKSQMVAQTPATVAASSNYYLGPLDQRPSIWRLGEYGASPV